MPARRYEGLKIAVVMIVFTALVVTGLYFALKSDPTAEKDAIRARIMAEFEAEEAKRAAEREGQGDGGGGGGADRGLAATPSAMPRATPPPPPTQTPLAAAGPTPTPTPTSTPPPAPAPTATPAATPAPDPEPPAQITMISASFDARGFSVVDHAYVAVTKPDASSPDGAAILDWSEVPVSGDETTPVFKIGPLEAPPQPLYAAIATDRDGGIYFSDRMFPGDPPADGPHMIDLGTLERHPTTLHLELEGQGPGAASYDVFLHRPAPGEGAALASELAEAAFLLTSPPTLGQYAGFSPASAPTGAIAPLSPLYPDDRVTLDIRPAGGNASDAATTSVPLVPFGDQYVTVDLDNLFVSDEMAYADVELNIVWASNGTPVDGATVRWADESSRQQWVSGADGRVVIPELEIGAAHEFRILVPDDPKEADATNVTITPQRTPLIDKESAPGAIGLRLPDKKGDDLLVWQQTVRVGFVP